MVSKTGSPSGVVEARRVPAGSRELAGSEFSYSVVGTPPSTPQASASQTGGERRRGTRRRTRLRSGKIVDADGRFLTECLVHDLSAGGGRLRLPLGVDLPPAIGFFDDQTGSLHRATILWRRGREVGVDVEPPRDDARARAIAEALRRKFYAIRG